jgi:hypothetical protein
MKQWIVILLLLAASISCASCVELEAGNANVDLGDGYMASFLLPDIGTTYEVEAYPVGDFMGKSYGFSISSGGVDLASTSVHVYSSPQLSPMPKASTEDSAMPDAMGPRVTIPKTISGAQGYVGYDLQMSAPGTDTSNAMTGFFRCFPGARKVSDGLESIIEVSGETSEFPASAQSLHVFNSMVDSIKISGPGI